MGIQPDSPGSISIFSKDIDNAIPRPLATSIEHHRTHKTCGGGGDVALEDEMLDDAVVREGVGVVVEGGGDFDFDGVVAGVEESAEVVVTPLAVPLHATVLTVDSQLADVIYFAEIDTVEALGGVGDALQGVVGDTVEMEMGGVGDGAGEVLELGLAEVAQLEPRGSINDGVARPALDGMMQREVPQHGDGEVVLAFVVGG